MCLDLAPETAPVSQRENVAIALKAGRGKGAQKGNGYVDVDQLVKGQEVEEYDPEKAGDLASKAAPRQADWVWRNTIRGVRLGEGVERKQMLRFTPRTMGPQPIQNYWRGHARGTVHRSPTDELAKQRGRQPSQPNDATRADYPADAKHVVPGDAG